MTEPEWKEMRAGAWIIAPHPAAPSPAQPAPKVEAPPPAKREAEKTAATVGAPAPVAVFWNIPATALGPSGMPGYYEESAHPWGGLLGRTLAANPKGLAVVSDTSRVTYRELGIWVDLVAGGLLRLELKRGEAVAAWLPPGADAVALALALAKIGAPLVPLAPGWGPPQVEGALSRSGAVALVFQDRLPSGELSPLETVYGLCPELETAPPGGLVSARLPRLRHVIGTGSQGYRGIFTLDEVMQRGGSGGDHALQEAQAAVSPDDALAVLFPSSGSASAGASLSHRRTSIASILLRDILSLEPADRLLLAVPLSSEFGLLTTLTAALVGATIIAPANYTPEAAREVITREGVTTLFAPREAYEGLVSPPGASPERLSPLRKGVLSAFPVDASNVRLMRRTRELGLREVLNIYGRPETGPISSTAPWDSEENIVNTSGRPLPHLQLKLVNPATGAPVPPGESGEICCRPAYPVPGGEWFHTGDMGVLDRQGCLTVLGRVEKRGARQG